MPSVSNLSSKVRPPSPQWVPDFLGLFLDNTAPGPRSSLDGSSNFSVRALVEMIIDSWASNSMLCSTSSSFDSGSVCNPYS